MTPFDDPISPLTRAAEPVAPRPMPAPGITEMARGAITKPEPARHGKRGRDTDVTDGRRSRDEVRIGSARKFSDREQRQIERLQARDREVRARAEAQRAAAGEMFRGGPIFRYITGPDGQKYAVDAQVIVETGPGRTPAETVRRAQAVARVALTPPSQTDADRRAAARAMLMAEDARRQNHDEHDHVDVRG